MLAPKQAVVRHVHDDRVRELAALREGLKDRGQRLVNGEEGSELPEPKGVDSRPLGCAEPGYGPYPPRLIGDVLLVVARRPPGRKIGEGALVPLRGRRRRVRRVRREVEEERTRRGLEERDGFLREEIGGVRGLLGKREILAVNVEAVSVVPRLREGDPAVPTGRHVRARIAVQVLADERGGVARVVEPRRHGRLVAKAAEASHEAAIRVHAVRVRISARQDAGPARATERIRHEAVLKGDAASDQLALHGRHVAERVPALVVGDDEDDVRLSSTRRRRESEGSESDQECPDDPSAHCERPYDFRRSASMPRLR
jgi:hypothetical protein